MLFLLSIIGNHGDGKAGDGVGGMEVLAGGMRLTATTSNKSRAVLLICQRHGSTALHQGSSTLDNPLL